MIDELPDGPDPVADPPSVFSQKAAASVLAQKAMVPQINAAIAGINSLAAGGAYSLQYMVDLTSTADGDPGAGKLRFASVVQNAATVLRLDTLVAGKDISSILDLFDASTSTVKGSIKLQKLGDPLIFLTFDVTARAAPTGYRNITVANTGGSAASPFTNGDGVMLFFQRTGDKGDVGPVAQFPMLRVRDEKPNLTSAAANVAGMNIRQLNTVKKNTIPGATLVSNQITLPAGTHRVRGSASAWATNGNQAYLYSVTDAATLIVGTTEYAANSSVSGSRSIIEGEFTLAAAKVLELRHWTATVSNFGNSSNSGQGEVYAELVFEKVA